MNRAGFFAFLVVLIAALIYLMRTADSPPETGTTMTPKEYIELVESKKAARRAAEDATQSLQQRAEQATETLQR